MWMDYIHFAGLTNRQIAQEFTISEGTVRTPADYILQELGLQNRNQLKVYHLNETAK